MADELGAVRRTARPTGDRQTPETVAQPGRGTTNTASASEDAETPAEDRTDDLRASLHVELTKTIAETAGIPQWRAAQAASCLLDEEGWRPPLPDSEGQSPWDAYVAAYRDYQETDPHGAEAHPTAHHMHALEAALRVYDPCAEHSETQWGYRVPWGVDVAQPSEAAARQLVDGSLPGARVLVRREVGPWTEVPRG